MSETNLHAVLEALLYLSEEPVTASALAEIVEHDEAEVQTALGELRDQLESAGRGLALREVAGGWRLSTSPITREAAERFVLAGRSGRLTQAALETLAVVAYKQPISRADVSDIRGVNADGAIRSLVTRGLVAEVGRAETPGQPFLYGTTPLLLEKLGLNALEDLPDLADHLPQEAPDEPKLDDLSRARRLLAEGRDLPSTGRGSWNPDDRGRPVDDEMDDLSARLETAAKNASARLKQIVRATDPDEVEDAEAPDDAEADGPDVEDASHEVDSNEADET